MLYDRRKLLLLLLFFEYNNRMYNMNDTRETRRAGTTVDSIREHNY